MKDENAVNLESIDQQVKSDAILMINDAISRLYTGRFEWEKWLSSSKKRSPYILSKSIEVFGGDYAKATCGTMACIAGGALYIPAFAARGLTPEALMKMENDNSNLVPQEIFSTILYGDNRGAALFSLIFYRLAAVEWLDVDEEICDKHMLIMLRNRLTQELK